jgi:hypothetical protein
MGRQIGIVDVGGFAPLGLRTKCSGFQAVAMLRSKPVLRSAAVVEPEA